MSIRRPLCHRFTMRRIPFFALLLLAGCASLGIDTGPANVTTHTDAVGRYAGRDEVRTNAATGRPEVMHYDAKGKYIGISR